MLYRYFCFSKFFLFYIFFFTAEKKCTLVRNLFIVLLNLPDTKGSIQPFVFNNCVGI